MIRAIAKQAEAERLRRAKIIDAEGELQAAERLAQAGEILSKRPEAMQLRYLGTLLEHRRREELDHRLPVADGAGKLAGPRPEEELSGSAEAMRSLAWASPVELAMPRNAHASRGRIA